MKCKRCGFEIKKGQKATSLKTFIKDREILEDINWHFECYLDWFKECVNQKAMRAFQESMKKTMSMIPKDALNLISKLNN